MDVEARVADDRHRLTAWALRGLWQTLERILKAFFAHPDGVFLAGIQSRNLIEVVSDASSRLHQLQFNVTANPGALLPAFNAPRIRWKRTTLFANYTLATLENNTDGAFAIPPLGVLDTEWGPAVGDVRHRLNVTVNNQIVRNLLMSFSLTRKVDAGINISF